MFQNGIKRGTKITTLFWTAVFGLILTTIYSGILLNQGFKAKKMITFLYRQSKELN